MKNSEYFSVEVKSCELHIIDCNQSGMQELVEFYRDRKKRMEWAKHAAEVAERENVRLINANDFTHDDFKLCTDEDECMEIVESKKTVFGEQYEKTD